jgi:hypothetical protein
VRVPNSINVKHCTGHDGVDELFDRTGLTLAISAASRRLSGRADVQNRNSQSFTRRSNCNAKRQMTDISGFSEYSLPPIDVLRVFPVSPRSD